MIIWTAICGLVSKGTETDCILEGKIEKRTNHLFAFLTMAYIIFFMGPFSSEFDMALYEIGFNSGPSEPSELAEYLKLDSKYPGFHILQGIFKTYVSTKFYHFTILVIGFDCIAIGYLFRKYSCDFALSVFLLITSGKIIWMVNGVKQFLAACIILAFSKFLMEKKFIPFAIGVLIASTIHTSAIVLIPVYFFVHGKPWNKKMLLMLVGSVLAVTFVSTFTDLLGFVLESTDYDSSYILSMQTQRGSTILHVFISAVPAVIALIGRKKIENTAPRYINVCINMSIVTTCVFLIASFTSGILMGRMPVYFQMYSFIALPWLIENAFDEKSAKTVKFACIVLYFIAYMMTYAHKPYCSKFWNLYVSA